MMDDGWVIDYSSWSTEIVYLLLLYLTNQQNTAQPNQQGIFP